jgi:hypothetical protein
MSKKNRPKKPKLTISAAGWSWLATNAGTDGWDRILDLREISLEAVFAFVKSRMTPEDYRQFEELNLPLMAIVGAWGLGLTACRGLVP